PRLVETLAQLPQVLLTQIAIPNQNKSDVDFKEELLNCYICLYYYAALANYWSQFYLPDKTDFDPSDAFHTLVTRVVDGSQADFEHMANTLAQCDQARVERTATVRILRETKDLWRHHVRTVSEVYASRDGKISEGC